MDMLKSLIFSGETLYIGSWLLNNIDSEVCMLELRKTSDSPYNSRQYINIQYNI